MPGEIVVLITASSQQEAEKIGRALVEDRLIACANIISGVHSIFFWEGKTQDEQESLLVCKSRQVLLPQVAERVKALHSYSVPEVIALPILGGSSDYLAWLNETTGAS